jgi:phosphoribosylamine--glycine ligase
MKSDFLELLLHAEDKKLSSFNIEWYDKSSCCVVAASSGYPGHYETGYGITISRDIKSKIFIAGAKYENHTLKTTGGRVLAVVAAGDTLSDARDRAYNDLEKVKFKNMYYRRDIGKF